MIDDMSHSYVWSGEMDTGRVWRTYISCLSLGPRAGSYRPPIVGRLSSSSKTGLTICLTDILLTSSVVKNENEMLATVEGTGCEMFMVQRAGLAKQCDRSKSRAIRIVRPD